MLRKVNVKKTLNSTFRVFLGGRPMVVKGAFSKRRGRVLKIDCIDFIVGVENSIGDRGRVAFGKEKGEGAKN